MQGLTSAVSGREGEGWKILVGIKLYAMTIANILELMMRISDTIFSADEETAEHCNTT